MKKSHSSKQWLRRHVSDPYVQRSKRDGYRSRSAYKLTEIDDRDKLLKPGMVVIDLGSAPGGWSQVLARRLGAGAAVIAIDLLAMEPNFTGIALSDQARTLDLAELARDFALSQLQRDGALLVKIFQGAGYDEYLKSLRRAFVKVVVRS